MRSSSLLRLPYLLFPLILSPFSGLFLDYKNQIKKCLDTKETSKASQTQIWISDYDINSLSYIKQSFKKKSFRNLDACLPVFTPQIAILISISCLSLNLVCGTKMGKKQYSLYANPPKKRTSSQKAIFP